MLVGLRMRGERLGHEPDLRERTHPIGEIRVENLVENLPVVAWLAIGVPGVNDGRTPFERRRAISGAEQIVGAEIDLFGPQRAEFTEQLAPVFHRGVIRFVRSEHAPDGC